MLFLLLVPTEENKEKTRHTNIALEKLLVDIAKQDTAALEKLYLQTQSAVYGFAMSFLKNKHTAEDIMQDTYIIIYNRAESYKPMGKPLAWIMTIVRNLCMMKLRKKPEEELNEQTQPPSTDDFTKNSEDRMVLKAALEVLTQEEQQIVMLHCVGGMKHREIADFLQKPIGTVLSKYKRALLKLEKNMKETA